MSGDKVETQTKPPGWRIALAFLLAPAAAAFALALFAPLYAGLPDFADRVWRTFLAYLLFFGYPATIILGLPAFCTLKSRLKPTPLNCALVGAAIAGGPWLLLGLLASPDYARFDGHVTHDNGVVTLWGLFYLGGAVAMFAALGFFAGLVFWVVAAFRSWRHVS